MVLRTEYKHLAPYKITVTQIHNQSDAPRLVFLKRRMDYKKFSRCL